MGSVLQDVPEALALGVPPASPAPLIGGTPRCGESALRRGTAATAITRAAVPGSAVRLRRASLRNSLSAIWHALRLHPVVVLDGPVDAYPRWGHGQPVHGRIYDLLDRNRPAYAAQLLRFLEYHSDFCRITRERMRDTPIASPCWINPFLPGLDAVTLYGYLGQLNPRRYFEIGSGNSTMFARQAIKDHRLQTKITSVDPQPRAAIDAICDTTVRARLEEVDFAVFEQLEAGDILFLDGSHYVFTNSDTVAFFLDILPFLKPGVIVQVHDIWLPSDYPVRWGRYWFAEQYLLATYLLGGSRGLEVILPNRFISDDPQLSALLAPLWREPALADVKPYGASFWMRTI